MCNDSERHFFKYLKEKLVHNLLNSKNLIIFASELVEEHLQLWF